MRVMYSFGMRGSWCEKTFWRPTSHSRIWSLGSVSNVLLMTWNSMMPRFSSRRAASSREVCAVNRLVYIRWKYMLCSEKTYNVLKFLPQPAWRKHVQASPEVSCHQQACDQCVYSYCRHVSINKIWRRIATTPRGWKDTVKWLGQRVQHSRNEINYMNVQCERFGIKAIK